MMVAKIVFDKLEMYIMRHNDRWLWNKDSTFFMAGSNLTHSVLIRRSESFVWYIYRGLTNWRKKNGHIKMPWKRVHSYMLVHQWWVGLVKWWEQTLLIGIKAWLTHILRGIVSEQWCNEDFKAHPLISQINACEQGRNVARNHSHSQTGEPRTSIFSRLETWQGTITTHSLESQRKALSAS